MRYWNSVSIDEDTEDFNVSIEPMRYWNYENVVSVFGSSVFQSNQ